MTRLRPTRLLAIGGLLLVGFLYWKPTQTYLHAKQHLNSRSAEVRDLRAEQTRLQKRIALAGTDEQLVREARRLGLVKPGERLFIVRGISSWRKHH
ncbi:MAG: septum formation initiator family protein [Actinobacteria bacterium]|nr:septum formation initiator family protein [Actinomycetota bacterium]